MNGFSPSVRGEEITAELLKPTQRLYVAMWVAYVIIIVLVVAAIIALWSVF
jgi:hypothetical protein